MSEFIIRGAGAVLLRVRTEKKLTLEQLATKSQIEKSQLAKYEANRVGVNDERLAAIANALGVSPAWLAHQCLLEIKPTIQNKPIGKLLASLVLNAKPAKAKSATRAKAAS